MTHKLAKRTLALSSILLTGCVTYTRERPPITLHQNTSMLTELRLHIPITIYRHIERGQLEQRLVELARTSPVEEAWVYFPRTKELYEIGQLETIRRTITHFPNELADKGPVVEYHIHPYITIAHDTHESRYGKNPEKIAELEQTLATEPALGAIPSTTDIETTLGFRRFMNEHHNTVETCIADHNGILRYEPNEQLIRETGMHNVELSLTNYQNGHIDYETLCEKLTNSGITLSYRAIPTQTPLPLLNNLR